MLENLPKIIQTVGSRAEGLKPTWSGSRSHALSYDPFQASFERKTLFVVDSDTYLRCFFLSCFRYLTASRNRNFLLTMRPFLKRAILVISYVSTYMLLKYLIRNISL